MHGFLGDSTNWATALLAFPGRGYSSRELYTYDYNWPGDNIANARGLGTSSTRSAAAPAPARWTSSTTRWAAWSPAGTSTTRRPAEGPARRLDRRRQPRHHVAAYACIASSAASRWYPGSSFIKTLTAGRRDPGRDPLRHLVLALRRVILPYSSTPLAGATNNFVLCQNHLGFLVDPFVLGAVRRFLGT